MQQGSEAKAVKKRKSGASADSNGAQTENEQSELLKSQFKWTPIDCELRCEIHAHRFTGALKYECSEEGDHLYAPIQQTAAHTTLNSCNHTIYFLHRMHP